ncbi:hypothetical protein LTR37_013797 [Vermiconidia calcicola]|uniref:Uncharacterized protein n=1 Tax=Vermiconidia calcicola TaxID=1690605 RepID=A0ACC3MVP9_9PEZI|nr:hypothetical protein LTR37_013797 [Vermiconidia calcicola]
MARPKDAKIEATLRQSVRKAVAAKEEDLTIKKARSRVEAELGLDASFFKTDAEWKQKSKEIIEAAFEESDNEPEPPAQPKATPKPKEAKTAKASTQPSNDKSKAQQRSKNARESSKQTDGTSSKTKTSLGNGIEGAKQAKKSSSSSDESEREAVTAPQSTTKATPTKPEGTPAKVNGVKRKAGAQSSSDEDSGSDGSSSEESSDESSGPEKKKFKKGSPSSSGEDSEEELETAKATPKDVTSPAKPNEAPAQSSIQAIPPQPFKPPTGFTALDPALLLSNNATASPPTNLQGKQVWHITAPSTVPLSSITELALDSIKSGQPVLTHNSIEYILNEDSSAGDGDSTVLVPTKEGYTRMSQKVERTLHLRQKILLPNLSTRQASQVTGSNAASKVAQASVSTVRPQPKGLRMRYKPPGFGPGKPGKIGSETESDEGEAEQRSGRAALQFPQALGAHATETMLRDGDVEMADAGFEDSGKKKKKKRKEKDREKHDAPVEKAKVNGMAAPSTVNSPIPASVRRSYSPDVAPAASSEKAVNGVSPEAAGKAEDKAKRKEEKRLKKERKEAKRKAREA